MNNRERIVRDARVVGGEPVFRGTSVPLRTVLASLAEGASTEQVLADFPGLSREDVRAAMAVAVGAAQGTQEPSSSRWDLDRLAAQAGEDAALAEAGLDRWGAELDGDDRD
jgi:uncharacterized protein (DUF433 family)